MRRHRWIVLIGLVTVLLPAPAAAQAGARPLSLEEAIALALEGSPLLRATGEEVRAAEAGVERARAAFLPRLDLAESVTHADNPVFAFSSRLNQGRFTQDDFAVGRLNDPGAATNFRTQLAVVQPLYTGGRASGGLDRARLAREAAGHGLERQRQETVFEVTRAYWGILLAEASRAVVGDARRAAEANRDRARARFEAGLVVESDVLSAEVRLAALREEAITVEHQVTLARAALNDVMGRPLDETWTVTDGLEPRAPGLPAEAGLDALALERRPDHRRLGAEERAQERAVELARAEFLPTLSATGSFEAHRADFAGNGQDSWFLGLTLQWNLFNGFADRARLREAEAGLARLRALRARLASAIRLEVKDAALALRAAEERIQVARGAVAQAQESLRVVQDRYSAGLAVVVDLLAAEAALTRTRASLTRALYDQNVGIARIELALGTIGKPR
jgi:outer membrane protein